jgi:hypothetical protein
MIVINTIVMVLGGLLMLVIVGAWVHSAWTGRDLEIMNGLKKTNPAQYRRIKSIGRFNGLLCSLMCLGGMIASPFVAFDPQGGVLLAVVMFCGSCLFLWLCLRWFWWAVWA